MNINCEKINIRHRTVGRDNRKINVRHVTVGISSVKMAGRREGNQLVINVDERDWPLKRSGY